MKGSVGEEKGRKTKVVFEREMIVDGSAGEERNESRVVFEGHGFV